MKYVNWIIISVILFFITMILLSLLYSPTNELSEISLSIEVLDSSSDFATISCNITNIGDKILALEYPRLDMIDGTYEYYLTNPDGSIVTSNIPFSVPNTDPPFELNPGDEYTWQLSFRFLEPGDYSVHIRYDTHAERVDGVNGVYLDGYKISNEVTFNINE